jgi:hypothetical protein
MARRDRGFAEHQAIPSAMVKNMYGSEETYLVVKYYDLAFGISGEAEPRFTNSLTLEISSLSKCAAIRESELS